MQKRLLTAIFVASLAISSMAATFGLKPTSTTAVMNITASNFKSKPLAKQEITFKDVKTKKTYTEVTDKRGKTQIMIPSGATYDIYVSTITGPYLVDGSQVTLPKPKPGSTGIMGDYNVQYDDLTFELRDVHFETGSAKLKNSSFRSLDQVVKGLNHEDHKDKKIEIAGHTDDVGDDEYNMKLSQERANSVRDYLVKKGIAADRLTAVGYGETQPVSDNSTAAGKAQNRRTEARIIE